jgi:hypothetical protein
MNSLYRVNTFGERGGKRIRKPGIRKIEPGFFVLIGKERSTKK